jgi:sugar/nucleoside kinase (ribokinase family)
VRRVPRVATPTRATVLEVATDCGAITVSRAGSMPPTYDELQAARYEAMKLRG